MDDFGWFTSLCSLGIALSLGFERLAPREAIDRLGSVAGLVAFACLASWILGLCAVAAWPRRSDPSSQTGDMND